MKYVKYLAPFFLLTLVSLGGLSAQTDLLDSDTNNIDDLFESDTEETSDNSGNPASEESTSDAKSDSASDAENSPSAQPAEANGTPLVDIARGSSVSLSGNFSFNVGYTAGYISIPWIPGGATTATATSGSGESSPSFEGVSQSSLTSSQSSMSLNFRIAPVFKVHLAFKYAFPTFKVEIGEFFADYSFKDVVYMRAGRFNINWGVSRYYPFTNLTARLPDSYADHPLIAGDEELHNADSYGLRFTMPVGTGGFDLLGFTRNGFMEDPGKPSMNEVAWGGTYNLAIPAFDITIGGLYMKYNPDRESLDSRAFASLKTTLFHTVEAYTEAVITLPHEDSGDENELTYGVNVGFLYGFFQQQFQLSGEYYYNTETEQLSVKGSEFPLIYGHNIAAGIAYDPKKIKFKVYARVNYNVNENTGIVIPGLSWNPLKFFSLTALVPVIFGDPEGTYMKLQPTINNNNQAAHLVIMAIFSGNF